MQGSFEKEVQRKMEELQLSPSAPLWEKIELEIREEKKKRRGIFWLLLAALLLAGGGWWVYNSSTGRPAESGLAASDATPPTAQQPKPETVTQPPAEQATPSEQTGPSTTTTTNPKALKALPNPVATRAVERVEKVRNRKNSVQVREHLPSAEGTKAKPLPATDQTEDMSKANQDAQPVPKDIAVNPPARPSLPALSVDTQAVHATKEPVATDSISRPSEQKVVLPGTTDSVGKKKIAARSTWRKEFSFSAGWSGYTTLSTAKSMVYANAYYSPGSSAFNGPYSPSPTTKGPAFAAGFSLSKKLGDRWEVSVGLQYALLTTKTVVGGQNHQDTVIRFASNSVTADAYYPNTSGSRYTNRFHLLELPVTVSYKPSVKVPLYLSMGAAYGRVLSTNALTFSEVSNVYFKSDDNYLRNTLPVLASAQVELFGKKKVALRTGPFVQYNLLKLQKESTGSPQHLYVAGLRSVMRF